MKKTLTELTSLERQANAGKLHAAIEDLPDSGQIEIRHDSVTIDNSSAVECVQFMPHPIPDRTLFYIPGSGSIAHHPNATNAECKQLA